MTLNLASYSFFFVVVVYRLRIVAGEKSCYKFRKREIHSVRKCWNLPGKEVGDMASAQPGHTEFRSERKSACQYIHNSY